jgi:hypothetical protein
MVPMTSLLAHVRDALRITSTGPPGATIVVFAAAAGLAGPAGWADVGERGIACAAGAALALLVATIGWFVRPPAPAAAPRGGTPAAAGGSRDWRPPGARVLVAGLVAGTVASVAGFGHPAWAQVGATATLQSTTAQHAVVRALQRAAGTAVGALLAWPLLAAQLGFAATCAVVVALQVVTEMVVGRNYGLAMLTITPMALLMTTFATPADPTGMAVSRALDTVVGAAFGVLAALLLRAGVRSRETPASP